MESEGAFSIASARSLKTESYSASFTFLLPSAKPISYTTYWVGRCGASAPKAIKCRSNNDTCVQSQAERWSGTNNVPWAVAANEDASQRSWKWWDSNEVKGWPYSSNSMQPCGKREKAQNPDSMRFSPYLTDCKITRWNMMIRCPTDYWMRGGGIKRENQGGLYRRHGNRDDAVNSLENRNGVM